MGAEKDADEPTATALVHDIDAAIATKMHAHETAEDTDSALKTDEQCAGESQAKAPTSNKEGTFDEGGAGERETMAQDPPCDADGESTTDESIQDADNALLNKKVQSREASSGEESVAEVKASTTEKRTSGHRRFKKIAKQRIFTNPEAFLGIHIPKEALASSDDEQKFEPRRTRSSFAAASAKENGSTKDFAGKTFPNNDNNSSTNGIEAGQDKSTALDDVWKSSSTSSTKEQRPIVHELLARSENGSAHGHPTKACGSDNDEEMDKDEDARWQIMYERLREYAEQHGNTLVPYRYRKNIDEQGDRVALGTWVSQQRSRHREGSLINRHVKKLEIIDFYWEVPRGALMKAFVAGKMDESENREGQDLSGNMDHNSTSLSHETSLRSSLRRTTRKSPSKKYNGESNSSEGEEVEDSDAEDMDDEPDAIVASVLPSKRKRRETFKAAAAAAEAAAKNQCIIVKIKMKGGKAYRVKDIVDTHDSSNSCCAKSARSMVTSKKKSVGMKSRFDLMVHRLKEYKEIKGDCKVPYRYKDNLDLGDPVPLGLWVSRQRSKRREDPTSHTPQQLKQLDDLGFAWEVPRPIPVPVKPKSHADATALALAKEESYDDALKESMRNFVHQGNSAKKKASRRQEEHSASDDSLRKSLGGKTSNKTEDEEQWNKMYKCLRHYKGEFGSCLVPRSYDGSSTSDVSDEKLGQWVELQRDEYRKLHTAGEKSELTSRRKRLLSKLGFVWQLSSDIEWDDSEDEDDDDGEDVDNDLDAIAEEEADGLVFGDEDSSEEEEVKQEEPTVAVVSVKDAVALAAAGGEAMRLDPPQARPEGPESDKLPSKGFAKRWEQMFQRLVEYKAEHGDCLVPYRYKGGAEPALGFWVSKQRTSFFNKRKGSKSSLSRRQIQKLDSIGFVWNPLDNRDSDSFPRLEGKLSSNDILLSSSDEMGYSEVPGIDEEPENVSQKGSEGNDKPRATNDKRSKAKRKELPAELFDGSRKTRKNQRRNSSSPENGPNQEKRAPHPADSTVSAPIRYHHTSYPSSVPHQPYYQSYYHGYHPFAGHQTRAPPQHPTWIPHRAPAIPTPSPLPAQNSSTSGAHGSKHIVHNIFTGEQFTLKRSELSLDPNIGQTEIAEVIYYL